jgi:hypothetical protein
MQDVGTTPESPETQPEAVREELHQENITHQGQQRGADDVGPEQDSHFGAVEDPATGHSDQTPVTPPMTGPTNLVDAREGDDPSAFVDPRDEILGG